MRDVETIAFNEGMNDMSTIHLYYSGKADIWQAFGVSAYILQLFATDNNVEHITDYSFRLMSRWLCYLFPA